MGHVEQPKPMARPGDGRLAGPFAFSTDGLPPKDRFESWRSLFGALHHVEIDKSARLAFRARATHWTMGPIVIGKYSTPLRRVVRTAAHVRKDYFDHWVLRVNRSARLIGHRDGRPHRAGAGDMHLETFASTYDFDHSAGDWIAVMVPRDAYPELSEGLERIPQGALVHGATRLLSNYLTSLVDGLHDAPPDAMPALAEATRSMITGCLLSQGTPECASDPCGQLALRNRAKSVILQNIGSARLDPARISELSGIKRSTLYRVFAAEGGVSAFVQDLRLNLVNSDLQDPACGLDRIATLAERRGFHNASSFNRAFRAKFGRTPGDVREASPARPSDGRTSGDDLRSVRDLLV